MRGLYTEMPLVLLFIGDSPPLMPDVNSENFILLSCNSWLGVVLDIDSIIVTSGATAALWAAIRMSTQREKKK